MSGVAGNEDGFRGLSTGDRRRVAAALTDEERAELLALVLVGAAVIAPQDWTRAARALQACDGDTTETLLTLGKDIDARIQNGLRKVAESAVA